MRAADRCPQFCAATMRTMHRRRAHRTRTRSLERRLRRPRRRRRPRAVPRQSHRGGKPCTVHRPHPARSTTIPRRDSDQRSRDRRRSATGQPWLSEGGSRSLDWIALATGPWQLSARSRPRRAAIVPSGLAGKTCPLARAGLYLIVRTEFGRTATRWGP